MANQNKLKAWVRYDGTNTVVTAGPIFRASKPKVGNWKQINADLCCNGSLTTTTTTTNGGGGTPTAWVGFQSSTSLWDACNNPATDWVLYTNVDATPLPPGTGLYTDAALTNLVYPYTTMFFSINGYAYEVINGYTNPLGQGNACANITTTTSTSTTQTPVLSFIGRVGNSGFAACLGNNQTLYTTGPLVSGNYPQNGIIVYLDQALTQPVTSAYVASPGIGQVWECFNGELYNQGSC